MHDEISFLFAINKYDGINNKLDSVNIFNNNIKVRFKGDIGKDGDNNINKNKIKLFLKDSSYKDNDEANPYIKIITNLEPYKQLSIDYSDLAYLRDLGVYPVNRLVILRRYAEGVIVPHNLNEIENIKPISTIIGWVKPEEDKLFSIGFSERWVNTSKTFWEAISDAVSQDTRVDLAKTAPVPGWGQGFLYQFLKGAGYVDEDFNVNEIPVGDPNVLRESSTRDIDQQGLNSSFNFSFNTSYEQKYINNIDSGSAFLDIIDNILKMGTSDMKYMLGGSKVENWMKTLNSNSSDYSENMYNEILKLAENFIDTLNSMTKSNPSKKDDDIDITSLDSIINSLKSGLNAAIYRFRWPLRGALGLTSGIHTTPWHITIGHPLNPVLSIGNILVENGNITFGNELSFNDIPTKIDISFEVKLSRSIGKNDILNILNNAYGRIYSSNGEEENGEEEKVEVLHYE